MSDVWGERAELYRTSVTHATGRDLDLVVEMCDPRPGLKVLDVAGPSTLGGTTDHQDLLMINQDRLPTRDSREFIDFMAAATKGPLPGILHLFMAHGLVGGWSRLRSAVRLDTKPEAEVTRA